MSLKEINFTFAGKHCFDDFGCLYVPKKQRPVSPELEFQEFPIDGMSGTISYGDEHIAKEIRHSGTLYILKDMPSQGAAQQLYRDIGAWLKQGRRQLIFDYEPGRYLMATVRAQTTFDESGWIDGGLNIEFDCQPFVFDLAEAVKTAQVGSGGSASLSLYVPTGEPAPLCCEIKNTGSAPITGVTVAVGTQKWVFAKSMSLAAGRTLAVNMEPPIGAEIVTAAGAKTDALSYTTQFDYIVARGTVAATVTIVYGTGTTKTADVRIHARGRWI